METIQEIPIEKIKINPLNPRKEFEKEQLQELSNSIDSIGLINPIQVKQVGEHYELICGERRFKAHKLSGKKTIKAIVKEYSSKDNEMVESLVENLHRSDLTSIEKENFITKLWESRKYKTFVELSKILGLSGEQIRAIIFAKKLREQLGETKVSTRDLRDIGHAKDFQDKKQILNKIENKEIYSNDIRDVANVINHSPSDVKQAYFSNKISIEQADKISEIKNEKTRSKMIQAHQEIKKIDKSIEQEVGKITPKNRQEVVRVNEMIESFRNCAIESQKANQRTMKSLIKTIPVINLMDESQIKRLSRFQTLLETDLANTLELSENLKERIEN